MACQVHVLNLPVIGITGRKKEKEHLLSVIDITESTQKRKFVSSLLGTCRSNEIRERKWLFEIDYMKSSSNQLNLFFIDLI